MLFTRQDPTVLQQQLAALKPESSYQKDEKEWQPTKDAAGNGSAVIRFLPARSGDELAFNMLVNHSIKNNGQWYIENCTSTHGDYDGCPVCKYISDNDLYNKGQAAGKDSPEAKHYQQVSRKKGYWANVLVIKDPGNPENEGKIFKFRFGTKIWDKINAKSNGNPELGEAPVNVTCPFAGCNFVLKIKKVGGFVNYDDSYFSTQSELPRINEPEYQQFMMDGMSDLRPITAKDQFKDFKTLEDRFKKVMGATILGAGSASQSLESELSDFDKQMNDYSGQGTGTESGGMHQTSTVPEQSALADVDAVLGSGSTPVSTPAGTFDDPELEALLNG